MKTVQIPYSLFFKLYGYFVCKMPIDEEAVCKQLEEKYMKICRHTLYTSSKTAATEEEREDSRRRYLDEIGMHKSFRR